MAARLRRERMGISVVFSLEPDGSIADEVFLRDAQFPMFSRARHVLDIEKLLKLPLHPQVANTIARWRAEQAGLGGNA